VIASAVPDLLATIVAATQARVRAARARVPASTLEREAARPTGAGRFARAFADGDSLRIIAECKRRSPSRGVLCRSYDPVAIARAYEHAGAAAISVLTEPTFFDGSLEHLRAVRQAVDVPLLRKDFIVDAYQLLEAAAAGADAVLLIVAAMDDRTLAALVAEATALGLDALVEAHDPLEVDRAVAAGARIIGVNNRNLRTLEVDPEASAACAARMPAEVLAVSESGLKSADDLRHVAALGYRAALVGERFMTAADPGGALRELLHAAQARHGGAP
jgi:indole-3-glycerol phosphate synthase